MLFVCKAEAVLIRTDGLPSFAVVDELLPRPNNLIIERHPGNIWDGVGADRKQLVTCEELDLLDENAWLFTEQGAEIFRHYPQFEGDRKDCGALVDFSNLHTLFPPDTRLKYTQAGPPPSGCSAYPQAGLVYAGHLQANSLITEFYPLLEAVNTSVLKDGLEEELLTEDPRWPIYGVSSQIYNAVMHSTRGTGSQHHEVARGRVSGALGGSCVPATIKTAPAAELRRSCSAQLPHVAYKIKSSNPAVCKDLRLENVYWVDMDQVAEQNRTGG